MTLDLILKNAIFEWGKREYSTDIKIPGIDIIEKRNPNHDKDLGLLCQSYVAKSKNYDRTTFLPKDKEYKKTLNPKKGDLIIYYQQNKRPTHIGIYDGQNKVISKWGAYHVMRHDIDLVPHTYGEYIMFYEEDTTKQ